MTPINTYNGGLLSFTGSVRLISRKTRVVEVLGPEPPGARRATDRELKFDELGRARGPASVGFCFQADGRRARFLIDEGALGDSLLELLSKYPEAPARLAKPYGSRGWLVEG